MSIQLFNKDFHADIERAINMDYYNMSVERLGIWQ